MTTCTLPPAGLARVTPDHLRAYLETRGWKKYRQDERFENWMPPNGAAAEGVGIPLTRKVGSQRYNYLISRAIMALYDGRCPRAVLADVLGEGEAVLRESVEELESKAAQWESLADRSIDSWGNLLGEYHAQKTEIATLHARVATLEAALGWYADEENYDRDGTPYGQDADGTWNDDRGKRAREALGQEATSG